MLRTKNYIIRGHVVRHFYTYIVRIKIDHVVNLTSLNSSVATNFGEAFNDF